VLSSSISSQSAGAFPALRQIAPEWIMSSDLQLSQEEISTARDSRWSVVGVAGTYVESLTILKLEFGKGETDVMSLNDPAIASLVSVLKAIVPKFDAVPPLPVAVNLETGRVTAFSSK
jgi:hypothetical protein